MLQSRVILNIIPLCISTVSIINVLLRSELPGIRAVILAVHMIYPGLPHTCTLYIMQYLFESITSIIVTNLKPKWSMPTFYMHQTHTKLTKGHVAYK